MKQVVMLTAIVLVASSVFAQDIDLGGFNLDIAAPGAARGGAAAGRGAPAGRGAAPNAANAPPVDRLVKLREILAQANAPLVTEQEAALNGLLNTEIPVMRQSLQARIVELQKAKAGGAPAPPPAPATPTGTPGRRGAPPSLPSPEELAPDINRLNDQLLGKIAAAPALKPPQQDVIKKLHRDQVRAHGGFEAIRLTMEDAGAPFSPEQVSQIQPLFDEQNQAKVQLLKESQGQPPDKAKINQIERDTLAKLLKLLSSPQRSALLGAK